MGHNERSRLHRPGPAVYRLISVGSRVSVARTLVRAPLAKRRFERNMKKVSLFILAAMTIACNNAAPTGTPTANSNSANRPMRSEQMQQQNTIAHTTENQPPRNATAPAKSAPGGDPIDTAKFDGVIAEAEKVVNAKPNDAAAKSALADAYFDRGFALTEARQYAAALGDYRKALKLIPDHEESKKWIDQIVGIYKMLNKEAPKEGEEPAPLPFKKQA
jgi:tetratricopeptide (TPR) repeat protein